MTQTCPHGRPVDSGCELCFGERRAEQPALNKTDRLIAGSKFKRSNLDSPNCELEREGMKYKSEMIEKGESLDLGKVQNLFIKTFGAEEVDPEEILRSAVDGTTPFGTKDITNYRVTVIKNEQDEVVSTVAGGLLELQDEQGRGTGEAMFMVGYAVTDERARQAGLAREAYISAILGAVKDAEKKGLKLSFAAGECTYTSEKYWNSVGWKRVYAAEGEGEDKSFRELEYVQPALDFEEKTGEVAEDAGEAPEHLMVDSFGANSPSKEQVVQTVNAFYRWCNLWPREAFDSDEAYQKHTDYVQGIYTKFKNGVGGTSELVFWDQSTREQEKERGWKISEYKAADHGETGEEDF